MHETSNAIRADLQTRIKARATVVDRGHKTPCWISDRATMANGYTRIRYAGKAWLTHRLAYEAFRRPIPADLVIDHLCRQRACVNPDHLEPVTNRENLVRGEGLIAQNVRRTTCSQGHPLDGSNLAITSTGKRRCRLCDAANSRRYQARRKVYVGRL